MSDSTSTVSRGTSNQNVRGNAESRRRRREWLVETYRADVDALPDGFDASEILTELKRYRGRPDIGGWSTPLGYGIPACRCYRCGALLTASTLTVDRIFPGVDGGTYGTPLRDKRERHTNIRPACATCNSSTGGALATKPKPKRKRRKS